jgi:hypothetical protein
MDSQKKNDAAYNFSISENGELFEVVITGVLTMESVESLMVEIYDIFVLKNVKKLLIDARGVKANFGYAETYLIAVKNPSYFDDIPTAIVHVPEDSHLGSFHENILTKNGLPVKWFTEISEARKWLKKHEIKKQISPLH